MDKKECLEECMKHWKYLAETAGCYKEEYFEKFNLEVPFNECYCCEYDRQFYSSCSKCPLNGYLWKHDYNIKHPACLSVGSPYREWLLSVGESDRPAEECKVYANKIVEACVVALSDLEKEEKKEKEKRKKDRKKY